MGSKPLSTLPYGSVSEFLRHGLVKPTPVGIVDLLTESIIPFTCEKCKVPEPEWLHYDKETDEYFVQHQWYRCKDCNADKYRWVTKKNLPKKILQKVEDPKNLLLLTFTMPDIVQVEEPVPSELAGYRELTLTSVRRMFRTKKNREKVETNGVRHLLKGWFYAYECKVTHRDGRWHINAHVHMIAERRFWFYHHWLKEQAVKAGLGRVVNIRHVRRTPEAAVRYIVKYILKDHKSGHGARRYYETGGTFRKSR